MFFVVALFDFWVHISYTRTLTPRLTGRLTLWFSKSIRQLSSSSIGGKCEARVRLFVANSRISSSTKRVTESGKRAPRSALFCQII